VQVGVIHRIADPEAFMSRGQALYNPPEGLRGLQFCPSQEGTTATCIWEGESVEAVRDLIDSTLGDASEQTYFAVDTEHAYGLPERAAATT
jgi:hypothetical protein